MPKLGIYLPIEQSIKKNGVKTWETTFKGGLGVEKNKNNPKYAKTRSLPTFWAKKSKNKTFLEKPKYQLF